MTIPDQPWSPLFGRLTLAALPLNEPIVVGVFVVVALGGLTLLGLLTWFRVWGYLWREWFTSVDHKKIGVMYMVLGLVMFLRGFSRRDHDAVAAGGRVQWQ